MFAPHCGAIKPLFDTLSDACMGNSDMGIKRRWMRWVFEEADKFDVVLPWERGADRAAWRRRLTSASLRLLAAKS